MGDWGRWFNYSKYRHTLRYLVPPLLVLTNKVSRGSVLRGRIWKGEEIQGVNEDQVNNYPRSQLTYETWWASSKHAESCLKSRYRKMIAGLQVNDKEKGCIQFLFVFMRGWGKRESQTYQCRTLFISLLRDLDLLAVSFSGTCSLTVYWKGKVSPLFFHIWGKTALCGHEWPWDSSMLFCERSMGGLP